MRCYLSGIMTLMGLCLLFAQTPIILEAGPISYPDLNTFVDDSYSVNVEDCSSISYSVDYSFSVPWGVGPNTMDSDTDCPVPQCAGDPSDPASPGCDNCWDFMWLQPTLDGNTVDEELIGISTNLNQSGTYTYGPICTDGATMAGMDIRNQNSAADEENTFSNVTLFCWEGVPEIFTNSPVCGITNIDLDGSVGNNSDVSSWSWTSDGNGVIDNPNIQNTFATSPDNGETYTLTATDDNSCTANTSQAVAVAAFTATLLGGGVTCINNCTDVSSDILLNISGGTAPYSATFTINGITIPQEIRDLPMSEVFRVCIDESQALPSFDDSQSPVIITASSTFFPFEIAINLITDQTNCVGTNSPDPVSIILEPQPNVVDPSTVPPFCTQANGTIDLTMTDDIINGGDNSLDVLYFESMDFDDEITDPSNYQVATNKIWAVTFDGTCYSDFICFGIDTDIQPFVENVMPIVDCSDGMYMLPPVLTIADITPISSFEGYFLDAAGTDGPYTSVPVGTTTVYIVARSSGQSCNDVIVPVPVSLTPNPTINSPGNMIGGCGNVELPVPDATDFISYEYNTDEMGNGTSYTGGQIIETTAMITTIYLIMTGNNNCTTTLEIAIDITTSINYEAMIPTINCDSLVLPAITPSTPTVAYYTMSGGMGTSIAPGTVVNAPFNSTFFIFDPNQDPTCAAEVPVDIIIDESPVTTLPVDTIGCGFYVLGVIPGTTSMTPDYFIEDPLSLPSRIDFNIGDTIRSNSLIYISDTIGTCTLLDSIQIDIIPIPYAGRDTMITACEGYSSTTINFEELIDNPDPGGTWSYPMEPDFAPMGPTMVEINSLTPGTYEFIYLLDGSLCGAVSATVTLIVEPAPYAGIDSMLQVCNSTPLDFTELLSDPDTGGRWTEVPQDNFNFADSTSVDISTLVNGTYFFQYTLGNPNLDFCEPNSATLTIDVIDAPMAGDDQMTTACLGNTVDIRALLSSDADDDGVFFPNGFFISGDNWITTGNTPNQNYPVDYIVESTALGCPSDTATIDIFLTENLSSGQAVMISPPCAGIEVDLSTYLEDASAGGIFVLTSDYTTQVDNPLTVDVTTDISYIIEGTGGCISDTTDFTVDVVPGPMLDYSLSGNDLCIDSGDCIELELNSNTMGSFSLVFSGSDPGESYSFMQFVDGITPSVVNICAQGNFISGVNDTIELNGNSESFELSSTSFLDAQCGMIVDTTFSEIINLNTSYLMEIDTTICAGDSILFDGIFYSSDFSFDGTSVAGCDSITQININNYPDTSFDITDAFCLGTAVDVFGMSLTRDTIATFIDENSSFFGCDSIINVDITFQNVATGLVDDIICDGMPVDVGGEIFDMNRPTGEVRLIGGSVAGCDSLITVDLTYGIPTDSLYTSDVCVGDAPVEINGTMYGPDLLSGTEILPNASGCDSTITIDLSLVPAIMVLRDDILCDGVSEMINGNLYDMDNARGTEMLTTVDGCDSIITIEFTFIDAVTINRDDQLCADGSEMINGVLYDINNPSGTEVIMTAGGCDTTIIINFDFVQNISVDRNDVLCEDDSEMINGKLYDINMPTGTEMLTSVNGCDSIININFTFMPTSATIGFDGLCDGATDTQLNITELNGLDLPVNVSINGSMDVEYMALPIIIPISSGTNDIMIDDGNCMYTETIEVQASMTINGEISSTTISANQTALSLTADGTVQNISWTSNNLEVIFSCTDCPEPIADSQTAYTATVTYEDENGCTYTDEILIEIPVIEVGEIFIPNIFSLSVSGNDRFYPQSSLPPALISEMRVFDRWGNVIFTRDNFPANDSDLGWDGTRDGKIIEQGVYVYLIKVNDGARDQFYSGSITVVR